MKPILKSIPDWQTANSHLVTSFVSQQGEVGAVPDTFAHPQATRVFLVDMDPVFGHAFADKLHAALALQWLVQAHSLSEARWSAQRCEFDVLLLNLKLPDGCGLELLTQLMQARPHAHVLLVSDAEDAAMATQVIQLGVRGYLLKSAGLDFLCDAIALVQSGGMVLCSAWAQHMQRWVGQLSPAQTAVKTLDEADALTCREKQILQLIKQGCKTCEIGHRLFISPDTVKTHLKHAYRKLHAKTRAEAVALASEYGIF